MSSWHPDEGREVEPVVHRCLALLDDQLRRDGGAGLRRARLIEAVGGHAHRELRRMQGGAVMRAYMQVGCIQVGHMQGRAL